MRLLHSKDLIFKVFQLTEDSTTPHAIISHRWTDEEISYSDFSNSCGTDAGWIKIQKACEIAHSNRLDWIWIDTCCIDKSSSAELSEAINSMFEWYRRSPICYAFFHDVHALKYSPLAKSEQEPIADYAPFDVNEFQDSVWLTRGWTLQELLAPPNILFFNSSFVPFGDKYTLLQTIAEITSIQAKYLSDSSKIHEASISERMMWASRRLTSRVEDEAYCLLGLLDVNMPLLYSEKDKAFLRLQKHIIAQSDDQSIFVWSGQSENGLLACRPADFQHTEQGLWPRPDVEKRHYELTNKGIRFTTRLRKDADQGAPTKALLPLNCYRPSLDWGVLLAVEVFVHGNASTKIMTGRPAASQYRVRFMMESDDEFPLILQDAVGGDVEEWSLYFPKTL